MPLVQEKVRMPGEGKSQNHDGGFHRHIQNAQDFVKQRRFADTPNIKHDQEADKNHRLGKPDQVHMVEGTKIDGKISDGREEEIDVSC